MSNSVAAVQVEHRRVHRRHALEDVDLVALDDLQRLVGVEARDQRQRAAGAIVAFIAQVCPKEWNSGSAPSVTAVRAEPEERRARSRRCAARLSCVSSAPFGRAGRARRVEDHRGVVAARGRRRSPRGSTSASDLLELAGLDHDAVGAGLVRARLRVVGEAVPREQQLGAGVAEVEGDLAALEQHVHRHDDAAGAQHAVVEDREVRDVGQHDPDAVARLDATVCQEAARRALPSSSRP